MAKRVVNKVLESELWILQRCCTGTYLQQQKMSMRSAAMAKQRHFFSHDQPGGVSEQILPKADEKVFFCYQDSIRKEPQ